MGALRDLMRLVRWSHDQPRPSLADALTTSVQATQDVRAYQDALISGVVGPHNGVPTTALVEEVRQLPSPSGHRVELVLRIDDPGQPRVTHTEEPPRAVQVGELLPVWTLRFEPQRFTIDWTRAAAR